MHDVERVTFFVVHEHPEEAIVSSMKLTRMVPGASVVNEKTVSERYCDGNDLLPDCEAPDDA